MNKIQGRDLTGSSHGKCPDGKKTSLDYLERVDKNHFELKSIDYFLKCIS